MSRDLEARVAELERQVAALESQPSAEPMMKLADVCHRYQVSQNAVYNWVAADTTDRIPHVRLPGGDLRFDPRELAEWFRRNAGGNVTPLGTHTRRTA